jgi:outer membrane protein OmpA-like peptidoglycan-associated protein
MRTPRITAVRLIAFGSGPVAPVAANAAKEGGARNRRVELVEQPVGAAPLDI